MSVLATAALKAGRSLAGIWMATVSFRKDKEGGAAIAPSGRTAKAQRSAAVLGEKAGMERGSGKSGDVGTGLILTNR